MKKILFISHDAYRAGAQLLFVELLKYFKEKLLFDFEILVKNGGELLPVFESLATTHLWNIPKTGSRLLVKYYGIKEKKRKSKLIEHIRRQHFDLVYSNTITNGELLNILSVLNIPVITHVHELNYWIEKSGKQNLKYIKQYTSGFITVSEAVKKNLIENHNIAEDRIELIHAFIDFEEISTMQLYNGLRQLFGIPDNNIIIGACGSESWRKGKDLFIPLAVQTLKRTQEEVHFIWIGGELSYELQFDLEHSGFVDKIHFIKQLPEANRYFNDIDIFLMLSREDPFPIVNLEVGSLGKPILCFNNTGGTTELLEGIKGVVSGYLNLEEMSDKIVSLINNSEQRVSIGNILKDRVRNQHTINNAALKIALFINKIA